MTETVYEATVEARSYGNLVSHPESSRQTRIWCLVYQEPLYEEFRRLTEQYGKTRDNAEINFEIITRDINCPKWYPYTPFMSPKEHLEKSNNSETEQKRKEIANPFNDIMLQPLQEELFILVVEASRTTSPQERQKFLVAQTFGGDSLIHPGIKDSEANIYFGDVEELARQGLIAIGHSSSGTPNFDVTSLGFQYYDYLIQNMGEAVKRVETSIRNYCNSYAFKNKYPKVFAKWSSAENLLWQTDMQEQLTSVGHICREAVQEFAQNLIEYYEPLNMDTDKAKTVSRIRAVLKTREKNIGETEKEFLDALLTYWGTVIDLLQRQEHGANREGEPLVWEDARRAVFQTLIVMYEIDKAL